MRIQLLLASLLFAPAAWAAGDMLTPDEVKHTGISSNPANESGMFIGAGGHFGQGRTTTDGATPGLAYFGAVEPGYQFNRGSWNRLEVSGEFFAGNVEFRTPAAGKATLPVGFGFLAKLGYGYSLGDKAIGLFKIGVGPVMAKYKIEPDTVPYSYESSQVSGLAYMLGWQAVIPMNGTLDLVFGVSFTQMQFDVSSVTPSIGGTSQSVGNVIANMPAADLGLRVRL